MTLVVRINPILETFDDPILKFFLKIIPGLLEIRNLTEKKLD